MNGLEEAACRGRWELFDSTDLIDHHEAATICRECPAVLACRDLLRNESKVGKTIRESGGGPRGTWAGLLIGKTEKRVAACGTNSGYYRHLRKSETVCGPCRRAHAAYEATRNAAAS